VRSSSSAVAPGPVNILGTRIYSAVWSQRDSPKRGMQPNSVICVEHFGRRT